MRFVLKLFLVMLLSSPLLLIGLVYLSIEKEPIVKIDGQSLSSNDIANAKRLLRQHDPRLLRSRQLKRISLNSKQLNLLGNYLTNQLNGQLVTHLNSNFFELESSFKIPPKKLNRYINLSISASHKGNLVQVQKLKIGNLNLPSWLSNFLVKQLLLLAKASDQIAPFINAFQSVDIHNRLLTIHYQWNPELLNVARKQLVSEEEQAHLYHYQKRLIELSNKPGLGKIVSIDYYLRTLFADARQRSKLSSPIDENRALLLVLGQHLSGRGHSLLFPETNHLHPVRKSIKLIDRHDFAQHFVISAALSAIGNSQLADLIGLQKELADSNRSSGFSFTDLAADRAGNYLGKAATQSKKSALAVQKLFQSHTGESSYMPSVKGLPEGLSARTFKNRFGSVSSKRFKNIEKIIETRIKESAIYRQTAIY